MIEKDREIVWEREREREWKIGRRKTQQCKAFSENLTKKYQRKKYVKNQAENSTNNKNQN